MRTAAESKSESFKESSYRRKVDRHVGSCFKMNESLSDETGKLTRTSIRQGNVQKANNIPIPLPFLNRAVWSIFCCTTINNLGLFVL